MTVVLQIKKFKKPITATLRAVVYTEEKCRQTSEDAALWTPNLDICKGNFKDKYI